MNPFAGETTGANHRKAAGNHTLPRSHRLLKPTDFKRVFRKNRVSTDRFFRVLARVNQAGHSRLGMAVSRKIDRRAVGRNRIKRVIRESFRRWSGDRQGLGQPAFDIVVLPQPGTDSICNEQLFESLGRHWARIETPADAGPARAVRDDKETD